MADKVKDQDMHNTEAEVYLLGTGSLSDFLYSVRYYTVNGKSHDEMDLADLWRAGAKHFQGLNETEKGAADDPEILAMPASAQSYIDDLIAMPAVQKTFKNVPVYFGMVELKKLVVYQPRIAKSTVYGLTTLLKQQTPSLPKLLEICLPKTITKSNIELSQETESRFVFKSDNHDFRFLEAQLLTPEQVPSYTTHGHPQSIIALGVGHSANMLNVVQLGNRLVLNNGYHRAYAMYAAGITHAPCIVQVCEHVEEVDLVATGEVYNRSEFYFRSERPPMLKDYFNSVLTVEYPSKIQSRQVDVAINVTRSYVK